MIPYTVEETELVGQLKHMIRVFIVRSDIPKESKDELIKELGNNWFDDRFSFKDFLEEATQRRYLEWKSNMIESGDLWKKIAIENASNSDKPYEVANETIKEYKKQFKID